MGGRAQPENGADSTTHDLPCGCVGDGNQTIMLCEEHAREQRVAVEQDALGAGKPRPTRAQITLLVLETLGPNAPPAVLEHEVAMVEMADRLGRAIHEAKKVGGPWGPACMRIKPDSRGSLELLTNDDFEQVPYGYDNDEYDCLCESMALHLVDEMTKANKLEMN